MLPDPTPTTAFHQVMDLKNYSPVAPEELKPIPPAPVTPNAIKENSAPPKRPLKRLNGKQMIRMDALESPVVPKKRNNILSKKSKIACSNLKVNSVIFCRSCHNNVSIDGNRKLVAQFCGRCRICTC